MIISYSKAFVMFAPWKSASSTLHARLAHLNESPYSRFYDFQPLLNRVVHQHLTCAEFAVLPEARANLYIGSFVRNPYDRVYSGFLQLQKDINEQPNSPYPAGWIRSLVLKQLAENLAQLKLANYDFDQWIANVTEDQVFEVGRNTSFPLHPAHYWTHLNGAQFASFVGRVEQFEHDIDLFCNRLAIELPERISVNVSGLDGDEIVPVRYRYASRMRRAALDKINSLFRPDFELFEYDML